jgi:hypothetical protein
MLLLLIIPSALVLALTVDLAVLIGWLQRR